MKLRQGIISIYTSNGAGSFLSVPAKNIIFRQAYHDFGLAYTFNFEKSYYTPITDCQIVIFNPDDSIGEALAFDYSKPRTRPLVRIWGGYSDYRMLNSGENEINNLKSTLNQVYAGFPIFYSDDKQDAGGGAGREISIQLTDISLLGAKERISELFTAGTLIINIIKKLMDRLSINADISDLNNDPEFSVQKIEQDVYFNNRLILEDIIPYLEWQYEFNHFTNNQGDLIFKVFNKQGSPLGAEINEISNDNGLILFANTSNWVDVEFKTLFGLPDFYYPGDRVSVKANNLNPNHSTQGLITGGSYQWNDTEAEIKYILNTFGQPANPFPILRY